MIDALSRVLAWAFTIGAIAFAIGFFGPIIVAPESNQGPLLGILITGPLGTVAGFVIGVLRELLGRRKGPLQFARDLQVNWKKVGRWAAAIGGIILVLRGFAGLGEEGRGAASAIVIGAALLWHAAAGRSPAWFRR